MKRMTVLMKPLSCLLVVALLISPVGLGLSSASAAPHEAPSASPPILHLSGDLVPGETVAPHYPLPGSQNKRVNLKLQVPEVAGDGTLDLDVTDGDGGNAFSGTIRDGETLWATLLLKPGNNFFALLNSSGVGGPTLDYDLWLYEIDPVPCEWAGTSQGAGTWRSHIHLSFPTSGLYDFEFEAEAGRYQFLVDNEYVQKTVEDAGNVQFYVAAGSHDVHILPDSQAATTEWTLNISGPEAGSDALPYDKMGGNLGGAGNDFGQEWLPLNLAAAAEANFELTLTGAPSDSLDVHLYGATGDTPVSSVSDVYGGETLWWTDDLPAGLSRLRLVADAANTAPLAYELTIHAKPTTPTAWSGISHGLANNSLVRFEAIAAGLYDLDFGVSAGRFQFLVNAEPHIQKTAETTGTVRYFLPAGTHDVTIIQDPGQPTTAWSLAITAAGSDYDSLPYSKEGGNLGGTGNPFDQEWLPLYVEAGGPANLELTLTGALVDGLTAYLYLGGAQVYASPLVYGGETFWWTADLAAGLNYVKLEAEGANAGPLQYALSVRSVPAPPYTWSGVAKGTAGNSVAQIEVPNAGVYHVTLDTPTGFAQILVDAVTLDAGGSLESPDHFTEFDVPLAAGAHNLTIRQDPVYTTTTWTASISPTAASGVIAHLAGNLAIGDQIEPQVPIVGPGDKEVNFRLQLLEAAGTGQLDLTITDGDSAVAFAGTALDGEIVWGSAILTPGQNTFALANSGATPLTYDLTIYEICAAPYDWTGVSKGAGDWDSHIMLAFNQDALYDFDFGLPAGRYQFLVADELVQKTAETTGTVTYFVPAGDHILTIVPDRAVDSEWSLDVSAPGAASNSLPYVKTGGHLWAAPAQFNEEWLPVELEAATSTNFQLTLTGGAADALDVFVYAGLANNLVYSITNVYGGETVWWTTGLPVGTGRVHLVANGANSGALAYDLAIHAQPTLSDQTPSQWAGTSHGAANNSHLRFTVAEAGLYDFDYDVGPGRFQFLVASEAHIQKTVETSGTVRYFLGAGTHDLTLVQDPFQASTTWSLSIIGAAQAHDALPYHQAGGDLGGAGNAFDTEWLPLELPAGQTANFRLALDGDLGDGLVAALYQGDTAVYTSPLAYGGETLWWTADLAAGVNQLKLVAQGGNAAALQYDLTVLPVPTVVYEGPHTWSGVAKGGAGHSVIEVQLPVSATYRVAVDLPIGFANLFITDAALASSTLPDQSYYEFDLPLDEGAYLFQVEQNPAYVTTTWTVTVSLVDAAAPEITMVSPNSIVNDVAQTLTLTGANFQPGAEVQIGSTALSLVTVLNSGTLEVEVPAGFPTGIYSVTVTNPDAKSATLDDALLVSPPHYFVYLPVVQKNGP